RRIIVDTRRAVVSAHETARNRVRIRFPCLLGGPTRRTRACRVAGGWLLNLVITRGTPPRLEGCRPASRGLTLALMTETKLSSLARSGASLVPRPQPPALANVAVT